MKSKSGSSQEIFLYNLLKCLTSEGWTLKEVQEKYTQKFPPSFLEKKLGLTLSEEKIQRALTELTARLLIKREITRFYKDVPLKVDLVLYSISPLGVRALAIQATKYKK